MADRAEHAGSTSMVFPVWHGDTIPLAGTGYRAHLTQL